eukprot:766823-Hanusia_phi.AAC.4
MPDELDSEGLKALKALRALVDLPVAIDALQATWTSGGRSALMACLRQQPARYDDERECVYADQDEGVQGAGLQ